MSGVSSNKPYNIAKRVIWEAYQQVRTNRGAAGIDDETIADFERNLPKNLYKLWNRMSSGSYFPPPVKVVEIPKASGGIRRLGVPTVSDRIAQTVVKLLIEPKLDALFHPDSYGYRPGRSAKQAIAITRERCWRYDWVVEFDIKAAFDHIDHELLMKAVRTHIKEDWILLYIERWLVAPFEAADGVRIQRERGTPQQPHPRIKSQGLGQRDAHGVLRDQQAADHQQEYFEHLVGLFTLAKPAFRPMVTKKASINGARNDVSKRTSNSRSASSSEATSRPPTTGSGLL